MVECKAWQQAAVMPYNYVAYGVRAWYNPINKESEFVYGDITCEKTIPRYFKERIDVDIESIFWKGEIFEKEITKNFNVYLPCGGSNMRMQ